MCEICQGLTGKEIAMNEVMKNLLTRRSVRKFSNQPLEKEIIGDIVKAALYAPSAMNRQTWKFTVVMNQEKIKELSEAIGNELGRTGYDMYQPTVLIIPSNHRDTVWGREDNACALENIFLAAHSYGVGSVWINQLQGICDRPKIRMVLDELGIPAEHVVYGMAAMGYPAETANEEKARIGEVAYVE